MVLGHRPVTRKLVADEIKSGGEKLVLKETYCVIRYDMLRVDQMLVCMDRCCK
jgi:hypothetical protein